MVSSPVSSISAESRASCSSTGDAYFAERLGVDRLEVCAHCQNGRGAQRRVGSPPEPDEPEEQDVPRGAREDVGASGGNRRNQGERSPEQPFGAGWCWSESASGKFALTPSRRSVRGASPQTGWRRDRGGSCAEGSRAEAFRHYAYYRQLVSDELGLEPSARMEELVRAK